MQNNVSRILMKVKIIPDRNFSCWQEGVEKEVLAGGKGWKVTSKV